MIDASLEAEKNFCRPNAFEKHLPLCVVLCNCIKGAFHLYLIQVHHQGSIDFQSHTVKGTGQRGCLCLSRSLVEQISSIYAAQMFTEQVSHPGPQLQNLHSMTFTENSRHALNF